MLILTAGLVCPGQSGAATIFDSLQFVDAMTVTGPSLDAALSGRLQKGNTERRMLSAGLAGGWRHEHWLLFATSSGEVARAFGTTEAREIFGHVRYRAFLDDAWAWELFTQGEFNEFTRTRSRVLLGGGPRYQMPTTSTRVRVAFGLQPMMEWLRFDDEPFADANTRQTNPRLSMYATLAWQWTDRIDFQATGYLQPRFADVSDYRALVRGALDLTVEPWLSVVLATTYTFDRTPAQGVAREDFDGRMSLQFSWPQR